MVSGFAVEVKMLLDRKFRWCSVRESFFTLIANLV